MKTPFTNIYINDSAGEVHPVGLRPEHGRCLLKKSLHFNVYTIRTF